MPNDTLGDEVEEVLKGAGEYVRSNRPDARRRDFHVRSLTGIENRLAADIEERRTTYNDAIEIKERDAINSRWQELTANPRFARVNQEQKARQQTFDSLRQVNDGSFPRNISPVIYVIPLILIATAEWYINYSTFATKFIPVLAIAATIIVGAIFAGASHFHGAYIKQLSEIYHPSLEYRSQLSRKIMLWLTTVLLFIAFAVIVWLRYDVIAEQLGINSNSSGGGTFGGSNADLVWSNLWPTIAFNVCIWGLGTWYAWIFNEKVPEIRERYRDLRRADRKLDRIRKPFISDQKRIQALYNREREKNEVAIKEYSTLSEDVKGMIKRLQD